MPSAAPTPRSENLFREVNEQIHALEIQFRAHRAASFVCECGRSDCACPIEASLEEYRAVRAHKRRFFVVDGHVDFEVERVVRSTNRYVVVERLGATGDIGAAASLLH